MSDVSVRRIASDITTAAPFDPQATTPPRRIADGYEVQSALLQHLLASGTRDRVGGWKIAANSPMLLDKFNLDAPITAPVFAQQMQQTPGALTAADYRQFAFEPEICAILGREIPLQPDGTANREDVLACVDRFVPAFELLDMRGIDMAGVNIADAVAQNISNVGIVLGGPGIAPDALDVAQVRTRVQVDGETKLDTTGAAPQDPVAAVAWLAGHLAKGGQRLEPGQFVLCGTHCPIWYFDGTGHIHAWMSGLGEVEMTLGG